MPHWSNMNLLTLLINTITHKACFMCCIELCLNVYLCTKLNVGCAIVCGLNKYQHCFNGHKTWRQIFCPFSWGPDASVGRSSDKTWFLNYFQAQTHVIQTTNKQLIADKLRYCLKVLWIGMIWKLQTIDISSHSADYVVKTIKFVL